MTTTNRNYRTWTTVEDEKLVEALLNMTNAGKFKCDNGFRTGYLHHLEASLKDSLPDSGILGKPHVESRIKIMKKEWQTVYDMLNSSGFGYDKETNSVTADIGVWEAYLEKHKTAGKLKDKKLPHFEGLCAVFGKDRASGKNAKIVVEMEDEVNMVDEVHQINVDFDETSHSVGTNSIEESSSAHGKKRKRARQVDPLVKSFNDAIALFAGCLKETSAELSEDIKFELDIKKKTLMIPKELSKITTLTQLERSQAIEKNKR